MPYVMPDDVTLIERPRRKLRVGSVWECANGNGKRYVVLNDDALMDLDRSQYSRRCELSFDEHPERWREVPVEELAREAGS